MIGSSGSGKTNLLPNLINHQPAIYKIYLYFKDRYQTKYHFLINKRESAGSERCNNPRAFIEYLNDLDDICESIEEYNPNKKRKILTYLMI